MCPDPKKDANPEPRWPDCRHCNLEDLIHANQGANELDDESARNGRHIPEHAPLVQVLSTTLASRGQNRPRDKPRG